MIEKNKMEKIKKTLKMGEAKIDNQTKLINTKGKKEHLSDMEQNEVRPGRVYAEMLTKLTMPDKLKDQLSKAWSEYLKETDEKKKGEMFNAFIKKYNAHTKALKIALERFYQREVTSTTKFTKAQEEIYQKLVELKGQNLKALLSKYEAIKQNDDTYTQSTKRGADEVLKETASTIPAKPRKGPVILDNGEIQGADKGRVFSQPGVNNEDPLWKKHGNDHPDFYNIDEYRVEPQPIDQKELSPEETENTSPDNMFLEAYRYLEMKNKVRNAYLKKDEEEGDEEEDKPLPNPEPPKPTPTPEIVEPNPYPKEYHEEPWDYSKFEKEKEPNYIIEPVKPFEPTPEPPKPTLTPEPIQPPLPSKLKIRAAFVGYNKEMAKVYARDIADKKMSEAYTPDRDQKFFGKVGNFFKRAFKYGVAREYYRQKEVTKAQKEILTKKNLFVDEDLSDHMQESYDKGILERFVQLDDIKDILHKGEKGKKLEDPAIQSEIVDLIKSYALNKIDDNTFGDNQKRIFEKIKQANPDIFSEEVINANNLLEQAQALRAAFRHQKGLENVEIDLDIMIGDIRAGARTEQKLSGVDRIIDKVQKTKLGKMINETTLASALSITFGVSQQISQFFAFNKAAQAASFGGTAVLSGLLGASRERNYWEQKRRQHFRDMAVGKKPNQLDKQRAMLETFKYQSIDAKTAISNLEVFEKGMDSVDSPEKAQAVLNNIALLEARIKLSDDKSIDLISYSSKEVLEKERTALDIKRAKIKGKIAKLAKDNKWKFGELEYEDYLKGIVDSNVKKIEDEEGGISEQNKKFAKFKNKQGLKAFGKGLVTGIVIGGIAQEGFAFLNPNQQGQVEEWFGKIDANPTSKTALKSLTDFVKGQFAPQNAFAMNTITQERGIFSDRPQKISLETNRELRIDNQGNYDLYENGKMISNDAIAFDADGSITRESLEAMKENGYMIDQSKSNLSEVVQTRSEIQTKTFVDSNSNMKSVAGTRDWMHNKTSGVYDLNELGTSVNIKNNNFVIDVTRMTSEGSFNDALGVDIKDAIKQGSAEVWVSFSRDTSAKVFPLPIGANGQIEVGPESPIYQLFKNNNGKAVFNGGFIEVVAKGAGRAGRNAVLSTVEGSNIIDKLIINNNIKVPKILDQIKITRMPFDEIPFDFPPFIPVIPGRPLEPTVEKEKSNQDNQQPSTPEQKIPTQPSIPETKPEQPVVPEPESSVLPKGDKIPHLAEVPKEEDGKGVVEKKDDLDPIAVPPERLDSPADVPLVTSAAVESTINPKVVFKPEGQDNENKAEAKEKDDKGKREPFKGSAEFLLDKKRKKVKSYHERILNCLNGNPKKGDKIEQLKKDFKQVSGIEWTEDFDPENYGKTTEEKPVKNNAPAKEVKAARPATEEVEENKEFLERNKERIKSAEEAIAKIAIKEQRTHRAKDLENAIKTKNSKDVALVMLKANYDSLIFDDFRDSEYKNTWEYVLQPKKGLDIGVPDDKNPYWLYRGKGIEKVPIDRCTLNIRVNKKVIDMLDEMIINKKIYAFYKIGKPGTNASAEKRRDSLTIYFNSEPSSEMLDKIKELAIKNVRGKEIGLFEGGFRYTAMGEIKTEHVEDFLERHKNLVIGQALTEFLTNGNSVGMSGLQFLAVKNVLATMGANLNYTREEGLITEDI